MSQRFYGRRKGVNPRFMASEFRPKAAESLPSSLSYESFAPPVFDQGAYGTCVANATASVMALYYCKRTGGILKEFSRAAIYSQAKHSYEPNDIQDDGLVVTDGLLVPQKFGYVLESQFPYPTDPTGQNCGNLLLPVPSNDWDTAFEELAYQSVDTSSVETMKRAMSEHGPLVVALTFPYGWESIGTEGYCPPSKAGRAAGGHCIYILAYDDNKFGGAFRCRNSWSASYGANGDMWIPYAAQTECPDFWFDEAYTVAFPTPSSS